MTLTTHGIAGALIGAVAYHNPPFALAVALTSHLLLDTIPHLDYSLRTSKEDAHDAMNNDIKASGKDFIIDLAKIGLDFSLGILIPALFLFIYHANMAMWIVSLLCAFVAIVPDPLQFVYMKTRSRILKPFQQFHMYMHAKTRLKNMKVFGIVSQLAIIAVLLSLMSAVI